ncbi:CDP-alcohol phosphatidyltransferase family protein [Candidatus Foliamicus sp.]
MEANQTKFVRNREAIRKRGIYLFPNLLTSGALFAGFYAIVAGADGAFARAAVSLYVAMILDALDGRVARLTGTETEFGRQYDSLSDVVAFGLGPAVVVYQWGLKNMGAYGWVWDKAGWLLAFLFAVGTALRLARFTARGSAESKSYFEGLPCPAAAGFLAGFVWLAADSGWMGLPVLALAGFVTLLAATLMCMRIAYPSFKHFAMNRRLRFTQMAAIPVCFALIALNAPLMLFTLFGVYVSLGPGLLLWRVLRKSRRVLRKAAD